MSASLSAYIYTIHTGRRAAQPCQQVLAPHYSKPGRKWLLKISFSGSSARINTTVHHTGNIPPGSGFAGLCKLILVCFFFFEF